jgi:hypothetical protein
MYIHIHNVNASTTCTTFDAVSIKKQVATQSHSLTTRKSETSVPINGGIHVLVIYIIYSLTTRKSETSVPINGGIHVLVIYIIYSLTTRKSETSVPTYGGIHVLVIYIIYSKKI